MKELTKECCELFQDGYASIIFKRKDGVRTTVENTKGDCRFYFKYCPECGNKLQETTNKSEDN